MKLLRSLLTLLVIICSFNSGSAQDMNILKMDKILHTVADSVEGVSGLWQFIYKDTYMMIMTDEKYNRMRIITPIAEQKQLDKDELIRLLQANYHSALDTKYAIADDILWAVFIHPLKELSENQFVNALSQVYYSALNFGTTYSSTGLSFGDGVITEGTKGTKKNK